MSSLSSAQLNTKYRWIMVRNYKVILKVTHELEVRAFNEDEAEELASIDVSNNPTDYQTEIEVNTEQVA